jgi:hypothetical protein
MGVAQLLRIVVRGRQRVLHLALAFLVRALEFGAQHDHGALQIAHLGQRQTQTIVVGLENIGYFGLIQGSSHGKLVHRSIIPLGNPCQALKN